MDNLVLNKKLCEYISIQKQEKELKAQKDALKKSILELMGEEKEYDNGYTSATIVDKENFTYDDEVAIIAYLENNGYEKYVVKNIDTAINKLLKEDVESLSAIKPYYTKSLTESLTIKEIK